VKNTRHVFEILIRGPLIANHVGWFKLTLEYALIDKIGRLWQNQTAQKTDRHAEMSFFFKDTAL